MDQENEVNNEEKSIKRQAAEELRTFISDAKKDGDDFVKKQAGNAEKHLLEYATGALSEEDLVVFAGDAKRLLELHAKKAEVKTKAAAQRIAKKIDDCMIKGAYGWAKNKLS